MVNINIDIPDDVHKALKLRALRENTPLKNLIVAKLSAEIEGRKKDARKK